MGQMNHETSRHAGQAHQGEPLAPAPCLPARLVPSASIRRAPPAATAAIILFPLCAGLTA